jgi:hypothetical protein
MAAGFQSAAGIDRQLSIQRCNSFGDELAPLAPATKSQIFIVHQLGDGETIVDLSHVDLPPGFGSPLRESAAATRIISGERSVANHDEDSLTKLVTPTIDTSFSFSFPVRSFNPTEERPQSSSPIQPQELVFMGSHLIWIFPGKITIE